MYGEDTAPAAAATSVDAPKSTVLDMLDTFEDDRGTSAESAVHSTIDEAAESTGALSDAEADAKRNDAVRRIKALRDSVRVG